MCGRYIVNMSTYRHHQWIMTEIPETAHHLKPDMSCRWNSSLWFPCFCSHWPCNYMTFASNIINVWPCFNAIPFGASEVVPSATQSFGPLCPIRDAVRMLIWWAGLLACPYRKLRLVRAPRVVSWEIHCRARSIIIILAFCLIHERWRESCLI